MMLFWLSMLNIIRRNRSDNHQRPRAAESAADQAKRLEYLERIVQGYAGSKDALDLDALKDLAEAADKRRDSTRPADISSQSSEFDGVDEKFEMRPLHGNVTRTMLDLSYFAMHRKLT
jgi:hypothetical protein